MVNVVTLPKTIDNDIWGTEMTFGFQSAMDIASTVIDSIHSTAFSHSRVFIVEVMGHKAGWLTLYAGIASGADVIIIPEIPYSAKAIAKAIQKREQSGKRFSILAVAEGAISQEEAKMSKKEFKAAREKMAYPSISYRIADELKELTGQEIRVTIPGHYQRGGAPCPADRLLTRPPGRCGGQADRGEEIRLHGRGAGRQDRARSAVRGRGQAQDRPARRRSRACGACARPVHGRLRQ